MGSRREDELIPDGSLDVSTHEVVNVAAMMEKNIFKNVVTDNTDGTMRNNAQRLLN